MPYIKEEQRDSLNNAVNEVLYALENKGQPVVAGQVNYVLSKIVWELFKDNTNYDTANMLVGVLESVKMEFYRRKVVPYEEQKMLENGDL